jgi:hypothetical protein
MHGLHPGPLVPRNLFANVGALAIVLATDYTKCWPCPVFIFCSISILLLAGLVAGSRPQCTADVDLQGIYSTIPMHWNIKSAPASPGRSRVGPALYVQYLAPWVLAFVFILLYSLAAVCCAT